jgi:hypothetical protein
MVKKELKTWLIADGKTGKFKVMSSKTSMKQLKSKLKPTEIPIELSLSIDIPDQPIMKAHGEIKLSQTEISKFVLNEMEEDENVT